MKAPRALGELKLVQYGRRRKKKKNAGELGGVRCKKPLGHAKDLGLSCRQKGSC